MQHDVETFIVGDVVTPLDCEHWKGLEGFLKHTYEVTTIFPKEKVSQDPTRLPRDLMDKYAKVS